MASGDNSFRHACGVPPPSKREVMERIRRCIEKVCDISTVTRCEHGQWKFESESGCFARNRKTPRKAPSSRELSSAARLKESVPFEVSKRLCYNKNIKKRHRGASTHDHQIIRQRRGYAGLFRRGQNLRAAGKRLCRHAGSDGVFPGGRRTGRGSRHAGRRAGWT